MEPGPRQKAQVQRKGNRNAEKRRVQKWLGLDGWEDAMQLVEMRGDTMASFSPQEPGRWR